MSSIGSRGRVARGLMTVMACLLVITGAVASSEPARAAECGVLSWDSNDQAFIVDYARNCSWLNVRHKYDPVWSFNNYWTSWYGGYGDAYNTPQNPVLYLVGTQAW